MICEHPWHVSCMTLSNLAEVTLSAFYGTRVSLPCSHSPTTDFVGSNEVWGSQSVTPCNLRDRHKHFGGTVCLLMQRGRQLCPDDLKVEQEVAPIVTYQIRGFYYRRLHSLFQYSSRRPFMMNLLLRAIHPWISQASSSLQVVRPNICMHFHLPQYHVGFIDSSWLKMCTWCIME